MYPDQDIYAQNIVEHDKLGTCALHIRSATTFEDLGLREDLLKGIYDEMNFNKPSRIQATTLPMILEPPYLSMVAQVRLYADKVHHQSPFACNILSFGS